MSGSAQAQETQQETQGGSAAAGWRWQLLKVAVSAALVWLVLRRLSIEDIKENILQTRPGHLVLPLGILVVSNLLGALQWGWLLRTAGIVIAGSRAFALYFAGLFLNNFLFGTLGGDVYKILRLGRDEHALGRVAGATLVDRLIGVSALCLLALLAAVSALASGEMPGQLAFIVLSVSIVILAGSGVLLHEGWGGRVEVWVTRLPFAGVAARGGRFVGYLREYRARTRVLNGAFGMSLVIQSARVLAHFCVGLAMGLPLVLTDLGKFFLVVPVLGLLIAVPISIGGWGLREWAGIVLFAPLGRAPEEAVTLLALTATLTLIASLFGAPALLAGAGRRRGLVATA
jgi:uncharacterized protein (TIRG00374 family)